MADDKLPGYEWILQITRAATPTTFVNVACLESNEMDNTTAEIDTTSKCDDGESSSIAGPNSWKMSGSGFTVDDRGSASKTSFLTLFKIWKEKETVGIRWTRKNSTSADYYYSGSARITSLKQTADVGDSVKFDVEFSGQGKLNIGGSY